MTVALLAHQGGWDEILLVAVPMVLIAIVLGIAKRRVDRPGGGEPVAGADPAEPPT